MEEMPLWFKISLVTWALVVGGLLYVIATC